MVRILKRITIMLPFGQSFPSDEESRSTGILLAAHNGRLYSDWLNNNANALSYLRGVGEGWGAVQFQLWLIQLLCDAVTDPRSLSFPLCHPQRFGFGPRACPLMLAR